MSKKSNIILKMTDWKIIIAIQIISSILFIGFLLKLGAFPMKYVFIIVGFIILLCVGIFFLMKPSRYERQGKMRNIFGKMISILLSILLLIGTLYISHGDSVINQIAGANSQIKRYSVVVMKDSAYENLSDLKNESIEVNHLVETDKLNEAIQALQKEESSIQISKQDDFEKMADDLYDGTVQAIFVNEAYFTILETNHLDFENETKVIWTYEINEEVVDFSKEVNVTKDAFTVYISGIDTSGKVSTVSRSDVNMLVTVNPKTKQILMTSIPRDYFVTLANKGKKDKLTHAGIDGVENSVKTIENFMDIEINYYAKVNFTSLITMVDALGGITVNSPVSFTTRHGKYNIVRGDNELNGDMALGFVRERYGLKGGDNDRVKNQQRVLTAMLNKMMTPAIITNYSGILNSIAGSFETNMTSSEITSLLQMQLNDMSSWNIQQIQLSGHGTMRTGGAMMPNRKLYYMLPDEDSVSKAQKCIQKVTNGEKISVE